jgi:hypothetical protein
MITIAFGDTRQFSTWKVFEVIKASIKFSRRISVSKEISNGCLTIFTRNKDKY